MKRLSNAEITMHLEEMGLRYDMLGVSFKPQAYARAAMSVADFGSDVAALFKEKGEEGLREIPGVGPGIAAHIASLLTTGTFSEEEKLKKKVPIDVRGLTGVEDVGPKRAYQLWKTLKIKDVAGLMKAAKAGKLRDLPGFGTKTEAKILNGADAVTSGAGAKRIVLGYILPMVLRIEAALKNIEGVGHATVAGSVRRRQETIGDLDFLVTSSKPAPVMKGFAALPEVAQVVEQGPTKMVVKLRNGMNADLRVVKDEVFGAALQYFTGSKDHNVAVRTLAIRKGLKLNEYGLWKGPVKGASHLTGSRLIACRTEEDVYRALGLAYIEPELRTNEGELEAAMTGALPKLIPYGSLRGDLQVQTDWTDGSASIERMVEEAKKLGLSYLAVTDHTKALAFINGLNDARIKEQGVAIDALNKKFKDFTVLKGTECDILKDGSLDLKDETLAGLDMVGVSVHSHFKLTRSEQTDRIIKAMRNPHVDVFFHPTGRLISKRAPYEMDIDAIIKAAVETGTALEIDAFPERSDLRDEHVRKAVKSGAKLVIDSDAHAPAHLKYADLGVAIARRGWATKADVLNTRALPDLLKWLRASKPKRK